MKVFTITLTGEKPKFRLSAASSLKHSNQIRKKLDLSETKVHAFTRKLIFDFISFEFDV